MYKLFTCAMLESLATDFPDPGQLETNITLSAPISKFYRGSIVHHLRPHFLFSLFLVTLYVRENTANRKSCYGMFGIETISSVDW